MKKKAIEWNNQGVQHFLKEEWDKAAECFNMAQESDSENPAIWNNMGLLAHQQKAYTQAVEFFKKASDLEMKPTYLVNEGNALAMQGKHAEAQSTYENALLIDPTCEEGLLSLAKLHVHLKQYHKGVGYLENLVKTYKKAVHYYELAVIYVALGQVSEARQILYSLAEKNPSGMIWYQLGRAEFLSKNYGIAEKSFKKALAENPDNKSFRHYLALNYLAMGHVEEGLKQLDLLLKLYPEDYEILTEKGVVLCGIQDLPGARECFSRALTINPDFSKAVHYRDMIAQKVQ